MSTPDSPVDVDDIDYAAALDETLVERDNLIAKMWSGMERLSADVESLASNQTAMGSTIEQILAELSDDNAGDEDPLHPWTRMPRTRHDWLELVAWVDEMSAAHNVAELPVCWPAHEQLVLELDAARSAWIEAARRHRKRHTSAMWNWYSYVWIPLRARLAAWDRCRSEHAADPSSAQTRMEFLPSSSDGLDPTS